MRTEETALVLFTILGQMAVGSFVILGIVHWWAVGRYGTAKADKLADYALLAIGPVMILGMLASLLHLGNPVNAYRAVLHVGTSWLSREILLGSLFAALGALFALLQWFKIGSTILRGVLAVIAAGVGLAFVFAMARVYQLPTMPAWNTWTTTASFFVTTFLLGALAMMAAYVLSYLYLRNKDAEDVAGLRDMLGNVLRSLSVATLALLGIELVIVALGVVGLSRGPLEAIQSANLLATEFLSLFATRLILVLLGAGLFAFLLYRSARDLNRERAAFALVFAAFAFVLVGEAIGRYLFYVTSVKIGL
ncbi:MAG: dimethyl sulfoxide reductase anchor subunit [Anaerolineae bacterium]|nr:dimethyl sulfoxide reductase anchor subunit [Anaerolineae bacterium]